MAMTPEYFQHDLDEQREIVDRYAAAARVIALHLREFCDESLPYDEMIADAARGVAEELAANRACNLHTWKDRALAAEDEIDTLCQAIEGHRGGALTNDGLWHYHEKARTLLRALVKPAPLDAVDPVGGIVAPGATREE